MKKYTAIVLAAGMGKRMNSSVPKQYLTLADRPVLYHALKAFEESDVTDIILVVGAGEASYCREEIIEKYALRKISAVTEGGKERYHSVYEGLKAAKGSDYVLIHDGARPLITKEIIQRAMQTVLQEQACVVGMPVKDTIKVVGEDGRAETTPERSMLWQIQTPQAFSYDLICGAYECMLARKDIAVTDDAMVLEHVTGRKVKVIKGSYENIKITTPEDLLVAETYLKRRMYGEP